MDITTTIHLHCFTLSTHYCSSYIPYTMSSLLSLPIEIQLLIVRKLPLRDCIAYAQVSSTCHDLVYYVFSHRLELDFSSVVTNGHLIISSEQFLDILHAHTRATIIRNFCLPHQFNDYAQLARYFNLYWAHTFIPTYDDSSESFPGAEPSMLSGTHVGHIRGELTYLHYSMVHPLMPNLSRSVRSYANMMTIVTAYRLRTIPHHTSSMNLITGVLLF